MNGTKWLGRYCGAEGVGAREFRGTLLVEDVEFFDGEVGCRQQVDDGPGEVASAGYPLLQRVETPLPAADSLIGGQPVLEEVQSSPGLEDPPHFGEGGGDVGDRAQRPRGQGGVIAVVGEGQ